MLHIGGHLQNFIPTGSVRPDFFVIDHMWANGLVSAKDYDYAMTYTERPHCNGLVPLGYKTREMKQKMENSMRQIYDLKNEDQLRRKEKQNVKGKETEAKFLKPRKTKTSQKRAGKSKMARVKHHGLVQALSQARGQSQAPRTNIEADEHQGDYHQKSTNDSGQVQKLMTPTDKLEGGEMRTFASKEDPDQSNMILIKSHLSNSEYTARSSRSRSTASSRSHTEAPSKTTELTSLSGSDSPSINGNQVKEQALSGYRLLSDELCFSNSIPVFSTSDLREVVASNPRSISERKYAASSIFSSESSLDLRNSHNAITSTKQEIYTSSRNKSKGRKYRVPDNGNDCSPCPTPQNITDKILTARKYISATSRGAVEVIDHRKAVYDPAEPRASDAASEDYQRSRSS